MMTASHPVIDVASHQKDLVLSKLLWTDDRVVSLQQTMLRPSRLPYLRLTQRDQFEVHSVIDAASHPKDLVKSKE